MYSARDTIVAIATPLGHAGLGVIRISGGDASTVAGRLLHLSRPLRARHATLTRVRLARGQSSNDESAKGPAIDRAIALYFPGPGSYTGEDVVEISGHGSPIVMEMIIEAALDAGARLAEPGEFTLRAFLNGRIDLVQAEAVRDLVEAVTPAQARAAFDQLEGTLTARIAALDRRLLDLVARLEASLDFPDEGYHFMAADEVATTIHELSLEVQALLASGRQGRVIREGRQVVIVGRPNVGKSTLFNALVGSERAIVTTIAGTTRDLLTERVEVHGVPVTLVDTAGIRATREDIELEGVKRATQAIDVADLLLVVLDRSMELTDEDRDLLDSTKRHPRLIVGHKRDLPAVWVEAGPSGPIIHPVSSLQGDGLDALRDAMVRELGADRIDRDRVAVTNVRHLRLLDAAASALARAREAAVGSWSEELVLADLQGARAALENITGARTTDDVLQHIFANFCVGK